MSTPLHGSSDFFALLTQDHARFEERLLALMQCADGLSRTEGDTTARDLMLGTLDFFATEGAQHEAIEEATLFPRIRPLSQFQQMLNALEFQHRMNRKQGEQLSACVERFVPGNGRELRRLAHRFVEMHRAHALGEERALFPLAASALSPANIEDMSREARQRHAAAGRTVEKGI